MDAEGTFIQGTIQEKTGQCIKNLKAVLTAAGSSIEKVVKVNIFLADMESFVVRPSTLEIVMPSDISCANNETRP